MSADPSATDILAAVADWLGTHAQSLTGREAYFARVAINALATVRRELAAEPEPGAAVRLASLLGHSGDADALNDALCAALRDGTIDETTPGLFAHLREEARRQLAIDQPSYKSPPVETGGR